jgi:hypothetical protein
VPAFAGIGQQIFVATLRAFDPGETEMQVAAIQVSIDHIHDIWPPVAVSAFVAVIPGHFQLLEIRFDAPVITTGHWVARLVEGFRYRRLLHLFTVAKKLRCQIGHAEIRSCPSGPANDDKTVLKSNPIYFGI